MDANPKFTFIDLFSGIGGFRLALGNIGGHCAGFSEINKDAIGTYCLNFNETAGHNLGDITKIEGLAPHDLLTGGVPCQSWSIAGKNLGFDDDRGQLWNDTIYLLAASKPKAFIFENVKGLVDPRNQNALSYILKRIAEAGYHASCHLINSYDYGVPQNRVRVYIVGFREKGCFLKFKLPDPVAVKTRLGDVLSASGAVAGKNGNGQKDLFGEISRGRSMSLSATGGFNDYFLFNDLRDGHSTVHSWEILETDARQKHLCGLLLKNRRKKTYGKLDGNPLSLAHFKGLDPAVTQDDLDGLVKMGILKPEQYAFSINGYKDVEVSEAEGELLRRGEGGFLVIDDLKNDRALKLKGIPVLATVKSLTEKNILCCTETRYDFKNTKISTGLFGVNRIFLPSSDIFPTLVASDTNDFLTTKEIKAENKEVYKQKFIEEVYKKGNYRKITKEEACRIQGFPENFILPENRARWMKLLGNSVSAPVIEMLGKAVLETGAFMPANQTVHVFS